MEKFIDKKKNKVVIEIDDEGNETIDKKYFEDKKKNKDKEDKKKEERNDA